MELTLSQRITLQVIADACAERGSDLVQRPHDQVSIALVAAGALRRVANCLTVA